MSEIDKINSIKKLNQDVFLPEEQEQKDKKTKESTEASEALAGTNKDSVLEKTINSAKEQARKDAQRIKDNWNEGGIGYIKSGGDALSGTVNIANKSLDFVKDMSQEIVDNLRTGNEVADKIIADGAGKALTGGGSAVTGAVDIVGSIFSSEEGSTQKAAQETWEGIKDLGEGVKNFGVGAAEATWEGAKTAGNFGLGIIGKGWLWGSDDDKVDKKDDKKSNDNIPENPKKEVVKQEPVASSQNSNSGNNEEVFTPIDLVVYVEETPVSSDDDEEDNISEEIKQEPNVVSLTSDENNDGEVKADESNTNLTASDTKGQEVNLKPKSADEHITVTAGGINFTIPLEDDKNELADIKTHTKQELDNAFSVLSEEIGDYRNYYLDYLEGKNDSIGMNDISTKTALDEGTIRYLMLTDEEFLPELAKGLYPLTDKSRYEAKKFLAELAGNAQLSSVPEIPKTGEHFVNLVKDLTNDFRKNNSVQVEKNKVIPDKLPNGGVQQVEEALMFLEDIDSLDKPVDAVEEVKENIYVPPQVQKETEISNDASYAPINTSPGRSIAAESASIELEDGTTWTIPIDEEPQEPENTKIYNWEDVEKVEKQLGELNYNYKTEYAAYLNEQGGKSIYSIGEDAVQDDDLIRLAIISDKSISEKLYDTLYPLNTDRKRTEAAAFIIEQSRNLGIQPVNLPEKKEDFIKLVKQNNIKLHLWNDDSISTDVPPDYVAPKNDIKSLLDDLEKDDKASSGINSDKNKKDIINHNGATKKQAASKKGKLPPKVKTPQAQNSSAKKVAEVKKQKSSTPSSRQTKDKKVIGETKNLRGKSNEKNLKFPNKTENAKNTGKATPPVNRPAESPKVINNANSVNKSSQTPKLKQSIEVSSNLMSPTRPLTKELKDAVNMIKEAKYEDYKDRYFKYLNSEAGGEDITSISIYTDTAPSALRQLMLSDYAYMVRLADTFFPLKEGTSNLDLEIFIDNVGLMCGERNLEIPRTKEEFLKLIKTKLYK